MAKELCRLCLSTKNLSPIFVNIDKSDRYTAILALTTGLKIESNDGFSQKICDICTKKVNCFIHFRNQCHKSMIRLLKIKYYESQSSNIGKETNTVNNSELCSHLTKSTMGEGISKEYDDETAFADFQIDVEFQRITDMESNEISVRENFEDGRINLGGKLDMKDGAHNINVEKSREISSGDIKIKPKSRKEKRDAYLELVDGVLDLKGPVRCKVCKKTVSKWSCFISHAKLHLGFKFMCEYCGKRFISSTQLKRHCRSLHGMQRELACRHCDYLALDNTQLVLHERRVHTGERPFVCGTCSSRYHSRRCLLQHEESHRPPTVQCERCPLKFKSARHLSRHRYTSHTAKNRNNELP